MTPTLIEVSGTNSLRTPSLNSSTGVAPSNPTLLLVIFSDDFGESWDYKSPEMADSSTDDSSWIVYCESGD